MMSTNELVKTFFSELKKYNTTNFKTLERADISKEDASVHKAFSAVITRYFIFKERHPEISNAEHNMLFYKLKLDLIARYFEEYPDTTPDNLVAFQLELRNYVKELHRNGGEELDEQDSEIQNIIMETTN